MDQHTGTISTRKKTFIIAMEVVLILVVLVLMILTYMPAIIGGNPESQ